MLSELINPKPSKNSNNSNSKMPHTGKNNPKRGGFNDLASAIPANPARNGMPTRPELKAICRRACAGLDVDSEGLHRFLEVAEDPAWTTPECARRLAERMAERILR